MISGWQTKSGSMWDRRGPKHDAPDGNLVATNSHTSAKHRILRRYLEAWFPILNKYNQRIVDGRVD